MTFGQLVIGPPGSGKTTYCNGAQQYLRAAQRRVALVNLDPANDVLPYEPDVDVCDLVCLEQVMAEFGLGPNGGGRRSGRRRATCTSPPRRPCGQRPRHGHAARAPASPAKRSPTNTLSMLLNPRPGVLHRVFGAEPGLADGQAAAAGGGGRIHSHRLPGPGGPSRLHGRGCRDKLTCAAAAPPYGAAQRPHQ